ncbi:MAG: nuclear transport factor 2 family protein [Alphaproteobacteria bacterium]|nr:nuclear transport factor 2 family protein [Alphaproteobacteria bacterium]
MSIEALAADFVALCKAGQHGEAGARYWSDDVVSLEPYPEGPHAVCNGRTALEAKHTWWFENTEVHSADCEGPFVHGDQFSVIFEMDCTLEPFGRKHFREIGLYTVKDGKIVEERFFAAPAGE